MNNQTIRNILSGILVFIEWFGLVYILTGEDYYTRLFELLFAFLGLIIWVGIQLTFSDKELKEQTKSK
jgi:hypothetical protein